MSYKGQQLQSRGIKLKKLSFLKILSRTQMGFVVAIGALLVHGPAAAQTFDAETAEKGVVKIIACEAPQRCWSGTGFVLNNQGFVGTNWHVVYSPAKKGPVPQGVVLPSRSNNQYPFSVVWMDAGVD